MPRISTPLPCGEDETPPVPRKAHVLDLFAGPGGWDEGVRTLGITPRGIELDTAACDTARAAGHYRHQKDIAGMNPRSVVMPWGPCRGLIASPPCQGFSMAGKGRGRDDAARLLAAIPHMLTRDVRHELHEHMTDDRSVLVLEPLRWALALTPSWLAWEQVPAVLPIWEACAAVLRRIGYTVATGNLHAEQHGVPQTRKRAFLVARAPWMTAAYGPARLPEPTHSRYYPRDPQRLDLGVKPWISMAEALGWGMTHRPSMTVTGGGTGKGGAEPFGNAARQGMLREAAAGRWLMCSAGRTAPQTAGQVPRDPFSAPSATITGKGTAAWVLSTGVNQATVGPGALRDEMMAAGRWREIHKQQERPLDAPAPTVDGKAPGAWAIHPPGQRAESLAEKTAIRVSVNEAAVLQSFPADYPWQSTKTAQYRQVGDAVPPLLARAVVAEVAGLALSDNATVAA